MTVSTTSPIVSGQRRTLYVTDMDGTLLDSYSKVSPESAAIISRLSREGALITVATARTPATVVPLMRDCHTSVPYITMTGAAMWDPVSDGYVEMQLLADDMAREVRRVIESEGLHPFVYTISTDGRVLHAYHNGPMTAADTDFVEARTGLALKKFHIDSPVGLSPVLPRTILNFAMGSLDAVRAAGDKLRQLPGCSVSVYPDNLRHNIGVIEVMSAGIDKGAVVRRLAGKLGVDRIVAFGDNFNDMSLLRSSDVAVAVDNALPEVKAIADVVIGRNDTDAVARYIEADWNRCL